MLVEVSNKTVKNSNVHAVWSCLLGCQSILAQEPSSSSPDGTVTYLVVVAEPVGDVLNRKQFVRISGRVIIQNEGSDDEAAGHSESCQQPVT